MKIIDIRNKKQFDNDHIPGSINVSFAKLIIQPEKYLNMNEESYIVCAYGSKSKDVAELLSHKGYKVHNIDGGYNNYRK